MTTSTKSTAVILDAKRKIYTSPKLINYGGLTTRTAQPSFAKLASSPDISNKRGL